MIILGGGEIVALDPICQHIAASFLDISGTSWLSLSFSLALKIRTPHNNWCLVFEPTLPTVLVIETLPQKKHFQKCENIWLHLKPFIWPGNSLFSKAMVPYVPTNCRIGFQYNENKICSDKFVKPTVG